MDELLGKVLDGKYALWRLLGEGGMGRVYLGEQLRIGRKVAVKVLHPWLTSDPKVAARFEREAAAAGRISHPNSVTVFDFGHDPEGRLYLVMEYLEGESLQARLQRRKRLPPSEAVSLLGQILAPLSACHAAGIIHRDLKPENILICVQGGREQVKLLDYGIARLADGPQVTKTGNVIGTPTYMSPEQIGGPSVGPAADIYAAGIIAYEMLLGRPPFVEKSHLEIFRQHIKGKVPSFASILPHSETLKPFEPVIERALAKKPEDRYRSAEHFHVALKKALEESFQLQESTPYQPEEPPSPFRKTPPSRRIRVADARLSSEESFAATVEASSRLRISLSATVDVDAPDSLGDAVTVDVESPLQEPSGSRSGAHLSARMRSTLSLEEETELDEDGDGVATINSQNDSDEERTSTAIAIPSLRPEDEDDESGDEMATMVDGRARTPTLSLDTPLESADKAPSGESAPLDPLDSRETALLRAVSREAVRQDSSFDKPEQEATALHSLPRTEEDSAATLQFPQVDEKGRPPTQELLLENVADSMALRKEKSQEDSAQEVDRNDTTDQTVLPEAEAVFFTDPQQQSLRAPLLTVSPQTPRTKELGSFLYVSAGVFLVLALLLFFWPSSDQSRGILIQTRPEGARVLVKGETLSGETPLRHALPVGEIYLTLIREGCDPWEGVLRITPEIKQIFIPLQGGASCER